MAALDHITAAAELQRRIKERARLFVLDNLKHPTAMDFLYTESAMQIGATINMEIELEVARTQLEELERKNHE
jgi:hypothetical protein